MKVMALWAIVGQLFVLNLGLAHSLKEIISLLHATL